MNGPLRNQQALAAVAHRNAFIKGYVDRGWHLCIIPLGAKGPVVDGWNSDRGGITVAAAFPDGCNVGLLHKHSNTVAIDLDHLELARAWLAERGIDLQALLDAPDAVGIQSGRPGSAKLLYKVPSGFAMPTKRIAATVEGERVTVLEFRHTSRDGLTVQDVLPPSVHPSGTVYQWAGKGNWQSLPVLPEALMKVWKDLVESTRMYRAAVVGEHAASMDEVESALKAIDPDSIRDEWVQVGMALQLAFGDEAFEVWNEWSSRGSKYKQSEMVSQWKSFRHDHRIPVTVGTLFHYAKKAGWKRPPVDVRMLFDSIQSGACKLISPEEMLSKMMPKGKTLDPTLFPAPMANYAVEVADEVGCDPMIPMLAGLCTLSGAVDKRTRLVLGNTWREPPIVWCMTLGEPADKKTPGSSPMFKPLYLLEREDRQRYEAALLAWQGKEAAHASAMKSYREHHGNPESQLPGGGDAAPMVPKLPPKPEPLLLMATDVTSQKLVQLAQHRPRGFLMYLDESAGWLKRVLSPHSSEDKSTWTAGYEGKPTSRHRVGTGNKSEDITVDCLAVSIYSNCQPDVLKNFSALMAEDGMEARFIIAATDPAFHRPSGVSLPPWLSGAHAWEQLIRRTYALPPSDFMLSPEAHEAFRQYEVEQIDLTNRTRNSSYSKAVRVAIGKALGRVARIALLFHIADDPYAQLVSLQTVLRAIRFVREFVISHLIAFDGAASDHEVDRWLFNRVVLASDKKEITLSELLQVARKNSRVFGRSSEPNWNRNTGERLTMAMTSFESEGWVAKTTDNFKSTVWMINPKLSLLCREVREQAIANRDELVSSIRNK